MRSHLNFQLGLSKIKITEMKNIVYLPKNVFEYFRQM